MTCRTRFAPSPTGYLHIGGARTALYCWLEARRRGGAFILRIEDTDRERSTQAAIDAILEAMEWLGLDDDEGPFYQTQRLDVIAKWPSSWCAGKAYYAYETKEELDAMREAAIAANEKPRYNGAYREQNAGLPRRSQSRDPLQESARGRRGVGGQGQGPHRDQQRRARRSGDLPLRRYPTYNFAVVVDDIDMQITDVVRGDDHLNNTPRQINIYRRAAMRRCPRRTRANDSWPGWRQALEATRRRERAAV